MNTQPSAQPFPIDLTTDSGCTYIIDHEIELNNDLYIAPGVTLIFNGGRFTSKVLPITVNAPAINDSYTTPLSGVTIQAPLSVIFGKNVSAKGHWIAPFTTPLWFEPEEKCHHVQDKNEPNEQEKGESNEQDCKTKVKDYADSINKAIEMRHTGMVYLPKGDYYISKPIKIPTGITLQGDSIQTYKHSSTNIFPLGTEAMTPVTVTVTIDGKEQKTTFNKKYPHDYMVLVNCDYTSDATPALKAQKEYPVAWTAMQNIELINYPEVNTGCRCIYAAGGAVFRSISWYDFLQAVAYDHIYSDGKGIIDCSAQYHSTLKNKYPADNDYDSPQYYMFNMGSLGDSVLISHNHLNGSPVGKVIYLNMCGGGSIQDNIINGDICIINSKAVTLSNNHMESNPQITIIDSVVSTNSNFIYKGKRPSIKIRRQNVNQYNPVVSMNNDQFVFCTSVTSKNEVEENKANKNSGTNDWPIIRERLTGINEFDIDIDKFSILNLINAFRYDLVTGFNDAHSFGLLITSPDGPIAAFNDYSYFCSQKSSILPNHIIRAEYTTDGLNKPSCWFYSSKPVNSNVPWLCTAGTYKYSYEIVWDIQRGIYGIRNNQIKPTLGTIEFTGIGQHGLLIRPLSDNNGPFFFQARLYREYTGANGNKIETVDLPICGTRYVYDNGFSIAGFRWKTLESTNIPTPVAPKYDIYRYLSGHVEAFAEALPANLTKWSKGDIIYNVGPDTSWEQKIIK